VNHHPDDCPILAAALAHGGEVHLPPGRSPASSTIARFAGRVGLTAALAFVPAAASQALEASPFTAVASSPIPGLPVMAVADVAALGPEAPPRSAQTPMETWSLRGTIQDERIELPGGNGRVKVRRDLAQHIVDAASETGADPDLMMAYADKESGFDPRAKAGTSTAVGLYQFLEGTWLEMVHRYGARHGLEKEAATVTVRRGKPTIDDPTERARILAMRENPRLASLMACEMQIAQTAGLSDRIGAKPTAAETYMAHMLGMSGASKFINAKRENPDAVAKRLFPEAAKSNKAIFHEGRRPRTMAQVHQVVSKQIDSRLSLYTGIAEKLSPFSAPAGPGR